jgi:hypothetical protein
LAISPVTGLKPGAVGQSPELRSRTQQVLQQTNLPPELKTDQAQLSDEIVGEVGKTLETNGNVPGGNVDSLIAGIAQNFAERKIQPAAGAEAAGDSKPQKEKKMEWNPAVQAGTVIPPQGRIGEITIKEEDKKPGDDKPNNKKGKPAQPGQAPAATKGGNGAPKVGAAQPAANAQKNNKAAGGEDMPQDGETVQLSPESQQMAQKMQSQGMNTPGLNPNDKTGGGAKGDKKMDVLMPSQGVTQAVNVRDAGPVKGGDIIMRYRKLDDLPSGTVAILKDKKGGDAVDEFKAKQQRGEQTPQLSEEQMRQLKNPVATH